MATSPPYVLFDTGPLLCFAAFNKGPGLLRDRYAGRSGIVTDVEVELTGLRHNPNQALADVAQRAVSSFTWVDRITVDDPVVLTRAEELRSRLRAFKRRPDQDQATSRKDWGECVTLAHAETLLRQGTVLVVANEDAARQLAPRLGIPTASAVDILRAKVRDGALTKKAAYTAYRRMVTSTVDAGDVLRGPDDL